MKGSNYYRVYNDRLDLVYETSEKADPREKDKLKRLLRDSELFLHIDNMMCYRVIPRLR